ncbi:hypothetical protein ASE31_08685 [Acidovorax sp. Root217]|nr:hypothetical protein ASE31_08685 [Acidovorax sp. Root217]
MLFNGAQPVSRWVYRIYRPHPWLLSAGPVGVRWAGRATFVFQTILVVAGLGGVAGHGVLLGIEAFMLGALLMAACRTLSAAPVLAVLPTLWQ